MSNWDETVFGDEDNTDFLDELNDLDDRDLEEALEDAINTALHHAAISSGEYSNGLCAATIAAIWAGAPYSAATVADDHPFIRQHIGEVEGGLQELALQLLYKEHERRAEQMDDSEDAEGLETFVEALS
ncbi:MAG TPA: DUF4259 domain-containing protein [Candidatus Corynebacterium gallistercoris]|uniref:DUF4259 domain-containing protein n=1 Tax=Candidatus Corynebacterium gallistercoris TaxID=2838530 RepID=A0A9D1UQP9_9CORY|nr:DUF4259 domain-containing protein [Candidatus Corynebacterium gallistercoris]